jgi:hypothetical protein
MLHQTQTSQPAITFSFTLGGKKKDALKSLSQIKDAMSGILIIHSEDEAGIYDLTVTYARLFYLAADIQYRQLLNQSGDR